MEDCDKTRVLWPGSTWLRMAPLWLELSEQYQVCTNSTSMIIVLRAYYDIYDYPIWKNNNINLISMFFFDADL